jgi:hypothetical protein
MLTRLIVTVIAHLARTVGSVRREPAQAEKGA